MPPLKEVFCNKKHKHYLLLIPLPKKGKEEEYISPTKFLTKYKNQIAPMNW